MTRKEQIEAVFGNDEEEYMDGFRNGAEWADANPSEDVKHLAETIIELVYVFQGRWGCITTRRRWC